MKPRELASLVHVARPPAPYGVRRLARCHSIEDLAARARRQLPRGAMGYLDGGGEDEHTLRANRAALDAIELIPSVLHDVHDVDTATSALGTSMPLPFALSPVGAPRLFHHEGELAATRAAAAARIPYGISTLATTALERVATEADTNLWFQLYLWGDRGVAKDLLNRAHNAGYRALLVSVDTSVRSKRERELHAGVELPTPHLTVSTLLEGARHPAWAWHFVTSDAIDFPNVAGARMDEMFDGTVCWDDLAWIRAAWDGPIALKGVLAPDDARRAVDAGMDGVIVSNHGGRQLDHVPATIDVLPSVVDAVGDRADVLMDSGIRRGTDIVAEIGRASCRERV